MSKIKFIKAQQEIEVPSGSEFLEIHRKHPHLPLKFGCRQGGCGICAIKVTRGMENLSKLSPLESKTLCKKGCDETYRLACQCAVNGPIEVL